MKARVLIRRGEASFFIRDDMGGDRFTIWKKRGTKIQVMNTPNRTHWKESLIGRDRLGVEPNKPQITLNELKRRFPDIFFDLTESKREIEF